MAAYFHYYCCSFVATIIMTLITQLTLASTQKIDGVMQHGNIYSSLINKQNHRIQLLELRNVRRDEEMSNLKMENSDIRKRMDQMNDKLNEVLMHFNSKPFEAGNTVADVSINSNSHHSKDKRIARLVPASLLL